MKVVDFDEFCALPDGTVFSYWEPNIAEGLYRRGKVISFEGGPKDFFEASLIASVWENEPPEVDLTEGRWGMFEYDQKFLVYEETDIALIAKGLGVIQQPQSIQDKRQRSFDKTAADRLAYEVAKCIERGAIGTRSGPADALLDYLNIGQPEGFQSVPDWVAHCEANRDG